MQENKDKCMCNEPITAFAFNLARDMESFINTTNDNLKEENQMLQGKILDFYFSNLEKRGEYFEAVQEIKEEYLKYFNIKTETQGSTDHLEDN